MDIKFQINPKMSSSSDDEQSNGRYPLRRTGLNRSSGARCGRKPQNAPNASQENVVENQNQSQSSSQQHSPGKEKGPKQLRLKRGDLEVTHVTDNDPMVITMKITLPNTLFIYL